MNRLQKFEAVNQCDNLKGLANVIRSFDEDGFIRGRTRNFSTENMAKFCESFTMENATMLTREFGIRQQAMFIHYTYLKSMKKDF